MGGKSPENQDFLMTLMTHDLNDTLFACWGCAWKKIKNFLQNIRKPQWRLRTFANENETDTDGPLPTSRPTPAPPWMEGSGYSFAKSVEDSLRRLGKFKIKNSKWKIHGSQKLTTHN